MNLIDFGDWKPVLAFFGFLAMAGVGLVIVARELEAMTQGGRNVLRDLESPE